jgi:hypothetical protein
MISSRRELDPTGAGVVSTLPAKPDGRGRAVRIPNGRHPFTPESRLASVLNQALR